MSVMLYMCVWLSRVNAHVGATTNPELTDVCLQRRSYIYIYMHGMLKDVMHMVLRESECMMQDKDVP